MASAHLCLDHMAPASPHLHHVAEDVDLLLLCNHLHHGHYGNQCTSTAHTSTAWWGVVGCRNVWWCVVILEVVVGVSGV